MTTAQDQQSRAEFEAHHAANFVQPLTRQDDAYVNGLVRCRWQGWQAARALPVGMEPVGWVDKRSIDWLADLGRGPNSYTQTQIHKTGEGVADGQAIFTAAQVQAMGRVPPEWQAVPMESTRTMKAAGRQALKGAADCTSTGQAVIVFEAMCAAAPRPPAAPATTEPQAPTTGAGSVTAGAAQKRKPLTDEQLTQGGKVGPIHTEPDGKVSMFPAQYRQELEQRYAKGFRDAERAYGIKDAQ